MLSLRCDRYTNINLFNQPPLECVTASIGVAFLHGGIEARKSVQNVGANFSLRFLDSLSMVALFHRKQKIHLITSLKICIA